MFSKLGNIKVLLEAAMYVNQREAENEKNTPSKEMACFNRDSNMNFPGEHVKKKFAKKPHTILWENSQYEARSLQQKSVKRLLETKKHIERLNSLDSEPKKEGNEPVSWIQQPEKKIKLLQEPQKYVQEPKKHIIDLKKLELKLVAQEKKPKKTDMVLEMRDKEPKKQQIELVLQERQPKKPDTSFSRELEEPLEREFKECFQEPKKYSRELKKREKEPALGQGEVALARKAKKQISWRGPEELVNRIWKPKKREKDVLVSSSIWKPKKREKDVFVSSIQQPVRGNATLTVKHASLPVEPQKHFHSSLQEPKKLVQLSKKQERELEKKLSKEKEQELKEREREKKKQDKQSKKQEKESKKREKQSKKQEKELKKREKERIASDEKQNTRKEPSCHKRATHPCTRPQKPMKHVWLQPFSLWETPLWKATERNKQQTEVQNQEQKELKNLKKKEHVSLFLEPKEQLKAMAARKNARRSARSLDALEHHRITERGRRATLRSCTNDLRTLFGLKVGNVSRKNSMAEVMRLTEQHIKELELEFKTMWVTRHKLIIERMRINNILDKMLHEQAEWLISDKLFVKYGNEELLKHWAVQFLKKHLNSKNRDKENKKYTLGKGSAIRKKKKHKLRKYLEWHSDGEYSVSGRYANHNISRDDEESEIVYGGKWLFSRH